MNVFGGIANVRVKACPRQSMASPKVTTSCTVSIANNLFVQRWSLFLDNYFLTAVISHTRPRTIFSHFKNYVFGGRQSNVSMTITASAVTGTTISMSILRVSELLFQLYLTRR